MTRQFQPGGTWRVARRVTQGLTFIAVLASPVLGAWQRQYRGELSAWDMTRWELPSWLAEAQPSASSSSIYEANLVLGGGGAGDYFNIAATDPIAGGVALLPGVTASTLIAWLVPIVLALLLGRVFCGWFCPFGWLSRTLDRVVSVLPWKHRGFEIPQNRPVRWAVLALAIVGGAFGGEWFAWAFLPHVLLQQTVYSSLILGGLGAVGGAFLGLVGAGVVFGPTVYCATICPTGAALGFLARRKVAHVVVPDPEACGSCTLCHRACWLGLDPKHEAGADCDLCARCFSACPKSKMLIEVGLPRRASAGAALLIFGLLVTLSGVASAQTADVERKPELLLNGYRETPTYTVALSVVGLRGVRMTQDTARQRGVELSLFVVAGSKRGQDEPGKRAPEGDVYRGPVVLEITAGGESRELAFERPSSPMSAIDRPIYRRRIDVDLAPGDTITLRPIAGLIDTPMSWTVPDVLLAREGSTLMFTAAGTLLYGGLLMLALARAKEDSNA